MNAVAIGNRSKMINSVLEEHNFIIHHNGYSDSKWANFFPNQVLVVRNTTSKQYCINHNLKTKLN
jgi:hypothetical protein